MASLYKKMIIMIDPVTGTRKKAKSKKWWGRYRDENKVDRRVPLATDKAAALVMLGKLVRAAERRAAGILDEVDIHRTAEISHHIREFERAIASRSTSSAYVAGTISRLRKIVAGCAVRVVDDITTSRVLKFLEDLRRSGKSLTTCNHYLRVIKMFTRWLVCDGRVVKDRVGQLRQANAQLDRRRRRRPLSVAELEKLIAATAAGFRVEGLSGMDRAIVYLLAAYTGLRRGEIASLTPASFDVLGEPPTVSVEAAYSKRRRNDVIPLRHDLAQTVRDWIAARGDRPGAKLFPIGLARAAEMLKWDMYRARLQWIARSTTTEERAQREQSDFLVPKQADHRLVDFHALRVTFITNLARLRVPLRTIQALARHSTISLTMNVYAFSDLSDQELAVEGLAPIPSIQIPKNTSARCQAK
jgi:integrase